jgi:phosphomannomutase
MGTLGLALDGDADRIGAMDERGNFVDPHKIMALALRYLVEKRGLGGTAVRTVSTTRMIDRLADKYGLTVYETPVGFNHIADYMMSEKVLIGGEESGGISIQGNIPEGDGVLMGLLLVEMVAVYQKSLHNLVKELLDEVGPAFYERKDQRLKFPIQKKSMVQYLMDNQPEEIGGVKVDQLLTTDGVKYILADDSWLLIRPSGTEPVLRLYAEGRSEEMVEALLGYGQEVAESIT